MKLPNLTCPTAKIDKGLARVRNCGIVQGDANCCCRHCHRFTSRKYRMSLFLFSSSVTVLKLNQRQFWHREQFSRQEILNRACGCWIIYRWPAESMWNKSIEFMNGEEKLNKSVFFALDDRLIPSPLPQQAYNSSPVSICHYFPEWAI